MDLGKSVRHRALRDLVTRRPIRTQRELVTALRAQGIPAAISGALSVKISMQCN